MPLPPVFEDRLAIAEAVVDRALQSLPEEIRTVAAQVHLNLESRPGQDLLDAGFEPDILGLFEGEPWAERGESLHPTPAQIILFLDNIADYVEDDTKAFREEVNITYLHELGHFLGWDEDDLANRELD